MNPIVDNSKRWLTALFVGLTMAVWAAPETLPHELHSDYESGVEHYRNGQYDKALKVFNKIVNTAPESIESRYYLAITQAQLGRFKEARQSYQDVIKLAPQSEAAGLSKNGLASLPDPTQLDAPPQFQRTATATQGRIPIPDASDYVENNLKAGSVNPQQQSTLQQQNPFGNMDPQAMQTMMMMSAFGGGGGGGFNPMMIPLMQSMMQGKNPDGETQPGMSPEVIRTMMMNQMMQDFTPFSSGKDD